MASYFTIEVDTSNPFPVQLGWVSMLVRPAVVAEAGVELLDEADAETVGAASATLAITGNDVSLGVSPAAGLTLDIEPVD